METNYELFNEYIVYFKNNPALTIWAKDYKIDTVDGVDSIDFIGTHKDSKIIFINPKEILYVRTDTYNVALEV